MGFGVYPIVVGGGKHQAHAYQMKCGVDWNIHIIDRIRQQYAAQEVEVEYDPVTYSMTLVFPFKTISMLMMYESADRASYSGDYSYSVAYDSAALVLKFPWDANKSWISYNHDRKKGSSGDAAGFSQIGSKADGRATLTFSYGYPLQRPSDNSTYGIYSCEHYIVCVE